VETPVLLFEKDISSFGKLYQVDPNLTLDWGSRGRLFKSAWDRFIAGTFT